MSKRINLSIITDSEFSVVVVFGDTISKDIFEAIMGFNAALLQSPFPGFIETVPAYTTLTVFYDPSLVLAANNLAGDYAFTRVIGYLNKLAGVYRPIVSDDVEPVIIPVCYGGRFGPDIEEVATHNHISISQLIGLHTAPIYIVYMLGFMPGFPYLGGMDEKLETPRHHSPRKNVPAGSVGIAGKQTGIYPFTSPGGWQLIGRTPLKLFDAAAGSPTLLRPGARVKFEPMTAAAFDESIKHEAV